MLRILILCLEIINFHKNKEVNAYTNEKYFSQCSMMENITTEYKGVYGNSHNLNSKIDKRLVLTICI